MAVCAIGATWSTISHTRAQAKGMHDPHYGWWFDFIIIFAIPLLPIVRLIHARNSKMRK